MIVANDKVCMMCNVLVYHVTSGEYIEILLSEYVIISFASGPPSTIVSHDDSQYPSTSANRLAPTSSSANTLSRDVIFRIRITYQDRRSSHGNRQDSGIGCPAPRSPIRAKHCRVLQASGPQAERCWASRPQRRDSLLARSVCRSRSFNRTIAIPASPHPFKLLSLHLPFDLS